MKRAIIAATALLSTSLTPILMTPAWAAVPSAAADPTPPDEQGICDTNYVNSQSDPSVWQATVTNAGSTATDPAPIAGTEQNVNFAPDTSSTFSYAGFTNTTNPLTRTGGSPNMWGQMVFNDKIWDNTLYDVQMNFSHDVTYNWTCHVSQYVDHPEFVPDPPAPPPPSNSGGNGGTCENSGNGGGNSQNNNNNQQNGGNGGGNNGCGDGNGGSDTTTTDTNTSGNSGGDNGCGAGGEGTQDDITAGNSDHVCDENGNPGTIVHHYSWDFVSDNPETVTNSGIDDGTGITQTGLQQLGHVEGVVYDVFGTYTPAGFRLLSCISPGKKGGAWTAKAYYTGGQCNTTVFNAAPTTYGTTFDTPPTASLPAL
jgi:hypothetical protein